MLNRGLLLLIILTVFYAQAIPFTPVNPNATVETKNLLAWLYKIQGTKTLSGQHNYIGRLSQYTEHVYQVTGKYPAIFCSDFAFADMSAQNGLDCVQYRTMMIQECIKYAQKGSLIKLMWHMCRPIDTEPCTWTGSVENTMTDAQWTALFTVGSPTYKTWAARMDTAALYLKQLEQAKIPVLWRPWHEMNGGWFWWGGNTTHLIQLWRQTYDYLTNTKHVNNLLWVWGPNQWNSSIPNFKDFYPGNQYVDILGADFYSDFFPIGQYNDLLSIGSNRPIAITESGFLPTTAMLNQQPKWSFFIMWCEHVMNAPNDQLKALYNDARVITADEVNYNPIVSIFNKSKDLYLLSNENLKGFYSPSITVYSPSGKEVRGFTDKRSGQNTLQNGIYFVKNGNVTSRIISVR